MVSKLKADYHTHTFYSHGLSSVEENAAAAEAAGLEILGIADHGPGHIGFGIDMERLPEIGADIEIARAKHPGLRILLNVEANIINPSGNLDVSRYEQERFDRIIAGYHFGVFGETPVKAAFTHIGNSWYGLTSGSSARRKNANTELVIKAVENNKIFMLSHPGSKAAFDIREIALCCAAYGTLMEINNHHDGLSPEGMRIAAQCGVGLIISSDAHKAENVGSSDEAIRRAKLADIPSDMILNLKEECRWN